MTEPTLVSAVQPLLSDIAAQAQDADQANRMSSDRASQLAELGVFRAAVPSDIGGEEVSVVELAELIETISQAHGSTGWCVMIGATTGFLGGYLNREGAKEIFSDPLVITGGAYAPTGRAIRGDDGNLSVTGRWEWGSGSENCSWLLGGAMVVDDEGEVVKDELGIPEMRLCYAPASEVEIAENWDVLGMRGTGSHDLVMSDVAVPLDKTVSLLTDKPWAEGPLFLFPPFSVLALGIAAVSLGVARGALESFTALATAKKPAMTSRTLSQRSTVRAEVAHCEADLRAARALYFLELNSAWNRAVEMAKQPAEDRIGFTGEEKASLRLAFTHAATVSADVCARLHRLGGGTAVRHGQVLERALRDSHTATQHILVGYSLYESIGGVFLGDDAKANEL